MRTLAVYALLTVGFLGFAENSLINVAFIYPQDPEQAPVHEYYYGLAGSAGRLGAQMAAEETGWESQQAGRDFRVLMANAPNAASAGRTAERMIAVQDVKVVIGGFEASHANALSRIAAENDVLFINVGSSSRENLQASHTLSLMPSYTSILQAIEEAAEDSASWLALMQSSVDVAERLEVAENVLLDDYTSLESISVDAASPVFSEVVSQMAANADASLVSLLDWRLQLEFISQFGDADLQEFDIWFVPDSVTGTREFLGMLRNAAPGWSGPILAAWDATLPEAQNLNSRFEAHFGVPMDTPAWASYQAVQLAHMALSGASSFSGSALRDYLISSDFDGAFDKGGLVHFEENGELHQDLYLLEVQPLKSEVSTLARQRNRVQVIETIPMR